MKETKIGQVSMGEGSKSFDGACIPFVDSYSYCGGVLSCCAQVEQCLAKTKIELSMPFLTPLTW